MKKKNLLLLIAGFALVGCFGGKTPNESESPTSSFDLSFETISSENIISSEENSIFSEELISSEEESLHSEELSSSSEIENSESSESLPEIEPLNTPSLTINEENGVVTWLEVENATHYNYIINDGEVMSTTSTTIELLDRSTISVQAANNDTISNWSYPVTYFDTSDVIINGNENVWVYFHNTDYESVEVKVGETISKPNNPTKINHTFENWYEDPFHKNVFDFSKPIEKDTIIYANYIEDDLIKNTYFWIKANNKMSASISGNTSNSGWNFFPLKLNESITKYKEFYTTVSVTGATTSSPCYFLFMDGFDDNQGRTYWKNNGSDFSITSDGIYNIYFSVETEYAANIHAKYELANNTFVQNSNSYLVPTTLRTPVVSVDHENNLATWETISGALEYEVMINNTNVQKINDNYITLNKKEFITVRAISPSGNSSWSIPNANLNYIYEGIEPVTDAFVYFLDSTSPAKKVKIGSTIEAEVAKEIADYTFEGWYEDIALTKKAEFPYTVLKNIVFYPKYTYNYDYATKEYYQLVDSQGNKVCGLTWNIDNYDFLEYETGSVILEAGKNYYVQTLDGNKSWGPYNVSSSGKYKMYFSEDNVWNVNSEYESHVYIAADKLVIYFSNNKKWSGTINAYMWNNASGNFASAWPGSPMTYEKTNSYGEDIYKVEIDTSLYDYIIFNNNSSQSKNIPLTGVTSGTGFYITDSSPYYGTYEFQ